MSITVIYSMFHVEFGPWSIAWIDMKLAPTVLSHIEKCIVTCHTHMPCFLLAFLYYYYYHKYICISIIYNENIAWMHRHTSAMSADPIPDLYGCCSFHFFGNLAARLLYIHTYIHIVAYSYISYQRIFFFICSFFYSISLPMLIFFGFCLISHKHAKSKHNL